MVHDRERCGKIEHMSEEKNLREDIRTGGTTRNVENKK
jgi:hypothetical protein